MADREQLRPLCRAVYLDTTQYIGRLPEAKPPAPAARGGAAAETRVGEPPRVFRFRAEAPRGRGGLAPRLIPSLPPIPRNYEYKMCGFCGARKDLSEPRARGLALMGPVFREQIKRP